MFDRKLLIIGAGLSTMLLISCGFDPEKVFSSRLSPNGSMIAETVLVGEGISTRNYLTIRNVRTDESHDLLLKTSLPEVFVRWIDDDHLEVWHQEGLGNAAEAEMLGNVHLANKSYTFPADPEIYKKQGIPTKVIDVPDDKLSVTFDQYVSATERTCKLSMKTRLEPPYDVAGAEFDARITANCSRDDSPCGGINSNFSLVQRHPSDHQTMLTSATVSDVPSYDRLPTGEDGTRVRGQFIGQSVKALTSALGKSSIQLEYSRDFFVRVFKFNVPLTHFEKAVADFTFCLDNADLLTNRYGDSARHTRR